MGWTQATILDEVKKQLQKRLVEKSRDKGLMKAWRRFFKRFCYRLFGTYKMKEDNYKGWNTETSDLGVDEYGRPIFEGILRYVHLLERRGLDVHTMLVLGSRAKGRHKPESDVDVLVIASNFPKGLKKWFILSDKPLCLGIESYGCTKDEFLTWLGEFRLPALDAIYYGKVVYDDGFWLKIKRDFNQLEEEYGLQETRIKQMLNPI